MSFLRLAWDGFATGPPKTKNRRRATPAVNGTGIGGDLNRA